MFLSEVAEAAIKTGEVNVELFAGVETVTLTHADANTGNKNTHRTMESVHRINSFLLKSAVRSGRGLSEVNCASGGYLRSAFWCLRYLFGRRNRMGRTTQYGTTF